MSIRVAIVEDQKSMRESLAEFIDGTPGFACVAACASAEEALRRLPVFHGQRWRWWTSSCPANRASNWCAS
jgi:hypothetical protein